MTRQLTADETALVIDISIVMIVLMVVVVLLWRGFESRWNANERETQQDADATGRRIRRLR